MALDKWQTRELEEYAGEKGLTREEALAELFPEQAPAPARKVSTTKKEPATA